MSMEPQIRYCATSDGVSIAYAVVGSGPPLLVLRWIMTPDVATEAGEEPQWRAAWLDLAASRTVVFWDFRGSGLSGSAATHTLESGILDMQAVVDAIGVTRFDVLAMMTPAHFAIAYAARYPERVRRMVLSGASHPGGSPRAAAPDLPDIALTHFRAYADLFALHEIGWDRPERARRLADFMAERYTGETWTRLNESIEALDATPVANSVTTPTLIIVDNAAATSRSKAERGQYQRLLAATIPNAQLSIMKKGGSRAYVAQVDAFLGTDVASMPGDGPPSGTAVILFTDVVDSTALTERLGDTAFRTASRTLDEGMRAAMREAGGTPVEGKVLGDGVMGVFTSASQAIAAARRCIELSAESELQLHVGLHAGDVIHEAGNVYGGAVNIASRICGLSAPGEVLVSDTVRSLARTSAGVEFEDRGEQALKGIDDAVRVYEVRWRD